MHSQVPHAASELHLENKKYEFTESMVVHDQLYNEIECCLSSQNYQKQTSRYN